MQSDALYAFLARRCSDAHQRGFEFGRHVGAPRMCAGTAIAGADARAETRLESDRRKLRIGAAVNRNDALTGLQLKFVLRAGGTTDQRPPAQRTLHSQAAHRTLGIDANALRA